MRLVSPSPLPNKILHPQRPFYVRTPSHSRLVFCHIVTGDSVASQKRVVSLGPSSSFGAKMPHRTNATTAAPLVAPPPAAAGGTPPRLKCGYLLKQSSGKWKRRRWNQRWVVLHYDTGVLTYFRHASQPEAVPLRQDAHGSMQLKGVPGVSMVIQGGGLSHGVPAPFCFTVADAARRLELRLCADSNQDFKEWTSAIASVMSPPKQQHSSNVDAGSDAVVSAATGGAQTPLDDAFAPAPLSPTVYSASSSSSSASSSPRPDRKVRVKGAGGKKIKGVLKRPSSLRVDVSENAASLANTEVRAIELLEPQSHCCYTDISFLSVSRMDSLRDGRAALGEPNRRCVELS